MVEEKMEMLNYKKETAMSEAEVLEAACNLGSEKDSHLKFSMPSLEHAQRTEQYVVDQTKIKETELLCNNEVPVKMEPGHNISTTALKPEVKSFIPLPPLTHRNPVTSDLRLTMQLLHILIWSIPNHPTPILMTQT